MTKKIMIYSIPRLTATGLHNFVNERSGKNLKKTKFGMARDGFQALRSPRTGRLLTGLDEPWLENGEIQKDKEGNVLTLQDKYEKQFKYAKGYLTSDPGPIEGEFLTKHEATYFQEKMFYLNDGCTILDLDDFDDLMTYHMCLASKFVANSEKEWRSHKWPYAKYYIAIENEAEEIKYKKNQVKSEAFSKLHDMDMTDINKRKIASILNLVSTRSVLSQEAVNNLLYEYIDRSEFSINSNIDKFNSVFSLLKEAKGKIELEARYLLKQALDCRLVYEKQGSYLWVRSSGNITIGERYSEAVDFLLNPKKDSLVEELKNEIKAKSL